MADSFTMPGASEVSVELLIDTGADVSLVPRSAIVQLIDSPEVADEYELEGFDGTRTVASAVRLGLRFLGHVFRGKFLITDQVYGILGRNVLNSVSLLFDGPRLTWEEQRL